MNMRVIVATVLGAIAMFAWSSVAHMTSGLGKAGMRDLPNEAAVMPVLESSVKTENGLYIFPAMDPNDSDMSQYAAKLKASPSGILIYHAPGADMLSPRQLITEFLTELAESLIAVLLLKQARLGSYGCRLGFVLLIGLAAAIGTNVSYWNWYGYPLSYTLSYMLIKFVGYAMVGLVVAAIVKPAPAAIPNV